MLKLQPENIIVDIPDLNRFQIGDHVIVDATADFDRFEGVIIGIELRRLHGSNYLKPSITLLHDGCITDEFSPMNCRKVNPSPQSNVRGGTVAVPREIIADLYRFFHQAWEGMGRVTTEGSHGKDLLDWRQVMSNYHRQSTPPPPNGIGKAGQIADAIEACDWSGCSIGNKEILTSAVALLRSLT